MFMNRFGLIPLPFYSPDDLGGGDGGGGAPLGAEPSAAGGGASSAPVAEPSVFDMDDDKLIRIKGQDKPVKFGEYQRGLQSQMTRASQRAAQVERQLQQEQALRVQYERQVQAAQRQQGQGQRGDNVMEAIQALPYLTGEDAARVVQRIQEDIGQRDQILAGTLHELKQLKQLVGGMHQTHSSNQFEGKISRFLKEGGFGEEYADLAREIYVAYEGDDLDTEFPQIFASRIAQLRKAFDAEREAQRLRARPQGFIPGRGAQVGPSKPLDVKPNATAREVADQLWGHWHGGET